MSKNKTPAEAPRGRGRPRLYADDAERALAHRERVADDLAELHMLRTIFARPTPDFIRKLAADYARQVEDKASGAASLIEALVSGLSDGGGQNCSAAAVNFIKFDFTGPSPKRARRSEAARAQALAVALKAAAGEG